MAKKRLTTHLFLLAGISSALALLVGFAPSESNTQPASITLQVPLQTVEQAELQISPYLQPSGFTQAASLSSSSTVTLSQEPELVPATPVTQAIPDNQADLQPSGEALPVPAGLVQKEPAFETYTAEIKPGDSLSKVLSGFNISNQDIYRVSNAGEDSKELTRMRPGQTLEFEVESNSNELTKLTLVKSRLESIIFSRDDNQFTSKKVIRSPDVVQTYKEATISSSLFVDGIKAGIDQAVLIEMANIFGWDIDFALDLREGDTFSLLYEEKYLDGEPIGLGNILAAQFINNGRAYQAIRYETDRGPSYYTPDGLAMRKAFLRTPVDFTRISSKFNPNRLHPIFKTSRPHKGVDYAASSGTPVKSAGDGRVQFAGKQNGYGNVVIIDHGKGYTTLYAHLKGFAKGIRKGVRIKQGKTIAFVGQTGWATGPHLHYEFRINGVHKNPVTVKLPNDDPMAKKDLTSYLPYAQKMTAALEAYHSPDYTQKLASLKK